MRALFVALGGAFACSMACGEADSLAPREDAGTVVDARRPQDASFDASLTDRASDRDDANTDVVGDADEAADASTTDHATDRAPDEPSMDARPEVADVTDAGGDAKSPGPVDVEAPCRQGLAFQVTLLDDRAVRLHYVGSAPQKERAWITDARNFAGPTASAVTRTASQVTITTAELRIEIKGDACSLTIRDSAGVVLWEEAAPYAVDATGAVQMSRKLDDAEHIYGLGEKTGVSERRGRSFQMWNSDPAWSDALGRYRTVTDPIYQSHPFFVSVRQGGRASGAFLNNTRLTTFDVGKTVADRLSLSANGGDVDVYFFDGPRPSDVLERYTKLTGRPFLPPLWTLGYHQSRWSYTPATRVEEVAAEFRKRQLPADGLWLDIDYMDGFRDFTWNATNFPDPAGMLTRLGAKGFKVTAILDPGVKSDPGGSYAVYNSGIAHRRFILGADQNPVVREVWPGNAVFPDFTSASVRNWWGDLLGGFYGVGLRGAWVDMNEPAVFTKDGFPLDAPVDGEGQATTFAEVKNVYGLLMARATYEGALRASPNRRPFVLTRAGFAGIQRYAAVWTGDAESTWEHLAMAPSMLAGMSVSGITFVGSDIGGFGGSPAPELYGRWFELGSLSPFFRSHVATGTPDQEPWSFGAEIESVARRMLAVRYALLPYWYDAYVNATRTGAPIVRPLWFEFPGDAEAHLHDDEFFVGASLLVAPVTAANVTTRAVYLPAGRFYEFYTGASYEGPTTVTMPAPLGRIPMFVRAGSVLPEQDAVDYVGAPSNGVRYLDVFPGAVGSQSTVELYEDDGETMAYASGSSVTTKVVMTMTADGLALDIAAPMGAFATASKSQVVRVHGLSGAPTEARVDGAAATIAFDPNTRVATFPALTPNAAHGIVVKYDATMPAKPRQVNVDLVVTLPASTPDGDIFVGSSTLAWKPDGLKLTRNGTTATGRLTTQEGTLIKLKFTRGTWATVEVTDACGDLANREVVADFGANGTTSTSLNVAHWVDHCP